MCVSAALRCRVGAGLQPALPAADCSSPGGPSAWLSGGIGEGSPAHTGCPARGSLWQCREGDGLFSGPTALAHNWVPQGLTLAGAAQDPRLGRGGTEGRFTGTHHGARSTPRPTPPTPRLSSPSQGAPAAQVGSQPVPPGCHQGCWGRCSHRHVSPQLPSSQAASPVPEQHLQPLCPLTRVLLRAALRITPGAKAGRRDAHALKTSCFFPSSSECMKMSCCKHPPGTLLPRRLPGRPLLH